MPDKAHKLYNKLLNIHKTQYDKLTKAKKKRIKVQNIPEKLPIDLYLDADGNEDEDVSTPMSSLDGNEKVKLHPEETTSEKVKLNPQKRK